MVLQVAVHRDDVVAERNFKARSQRRRLSRIARQSYHRHAPILQGDIAQQTGALISAAVIHQDELERIAERLHGFLELLIELQEIVPLIVERDDDAVPDGFADCGGHQDFRPRTLHLNLTIRHT
jgi:hypothetical protein